MARIAYGLVVVGLMQSWCGDYWEHISSVKRYGRPWLVARVREYPRIALAAVRAAAAAQACIVWLMCVVVTYDCDS